MKKIKYGVTLIIFITILIMFLIKSIRLGNYENFIPVISTIFAFFIPIIVEKIFKIKLPDILKTFFVIFIFVSKFMGGDNFYFSTMPLYDKIIHLIYGIFSYFISIFILVRFVRIKKTNILFNIFFCIVFALGTSVIWEFLEFAFDKVLYQNNQRLETGINDTMFDLMYTSMSCIIVSMFYYVEEKLNKSIIVNKFINSLNKV